MKKRASPTSIGVTARRVVAALSARGIDPKPLLHRSGLSPKTLWDTDRRVSCRLENALIEMAAEAADEPLFGLRLVEESIARETGLIFYMVNASATLGAAMEVYGRYIQIANACRAVVIRLPKEGPATVDFQYVGLARHLLRHTVEYHVAGFVKDLREIAGPDVSPSRVTFSHFRSGPVTEFERFFRCPVRFGGDADQLEFDRGTLDIVTREANPALLEILRGFADKSMTRLDASAGSFRAAVESELHRKLPQGGGDIEEVALALNVGTRSLVRRLSEEGTSFSDVRDTLRRALALRYLMDSQLSLGQVAWLLGYRDIAVFTNAFRRWFDMTPTVARDNPALMETLDGSTRTQTPGK